MYQILLLKSVGFTKIKYKHRKPINKFAKHSTYNNPI